MELLPVLEPTDQPKEGIWYSLTPGGSAPGVSVGHTCTFCPSADAEKGKIVIVGGANPSGTFSHSHILNLDSHEWDVPEWEGLDERYEHCSFVPQGRPRSLWVFGGAEHSGNRNCIQNIQLSDSRPCWKKVSVSGEPPSARTYHTNSASIGDKLFVFSGGEAGVAAISDPKLHVFDTASCTWSRPETHGKHPPPRQGHIIVAVGSWIFIHGGMAGDTFHSDMYSLDTSTMKWEEVQAKGDAPPGVAAHSAVALGSNIYTFGGMTADGASNSMYRFNADKRGWMRMKFDGDLPPNRLDHSMCLMPWKASDGEKANTTGSKTTYLAFVFGGMDTHGVIHSDSLVTVVT